MPEKLKEQAPDSVFTEALLRHASEEMGRYEKISSSQEQMRTIVANHVELDRVQHQAMTKDISEVKTTVERLAQSMDATSHRLTDALTANTKELATAVTGIQEILRDHTQRHERTEKAFLVNEDGEADFAGHKNFHTKSLDGARRRQKIIDGVVQGMMLSATVGFLLFIGRLIWIAMLQGPQQ